MNHLVVNLSAMKPIADAQHADLQLMRRLRDNDESAMEELIQKHGDELRTLIGRLTAWNGDADDILQEVLVTAWQKAGQFNGQGSLPAWLRVLAVNRCKNQFRARDALKQLLQRVAIQLQGQEVETQHRLVAKSRIERALATLKASDRVVLVLYYLEELKGEEVAELLKIRVDAVHMRLRRARERLRHALHETDESNA